eukprot:132917-Chlamydomonas_euryale.AAC.2
MTSSKSSNTSGGGASSAATTVRLRSLRCEQHRTERVMKPRGMGAPQWRAPSGGVPAGMRITLNKPIENCFLV